MFGIWSCGILIDSTTDRVQSISSIIACCSDGVAATRATKATATVRNAQRPGRRRRATERRADPIGKFTDGSVTGATWSARARGSDTPGSDMLGVGTFG